MIKQLKIRGYKSLKKLDLELGPLTALIGPNAGGKTNLLDFFAFLSEAVNEKMQKAVPDRGGFQSLVFAGGADRISWDLEFGPVGTLPFEESGIRYKVELKGIRHMHTIESEEITKDSMPLVTARKGKATFRRMSHKALENLDTTPEMNLMDSELSIAQVRDPQAYPTLDRVRTYIASWTTYGNFDTGINSSIRQAQFAGPDNRLLPDGSNLTTVLYSLRNHSEYRSEYGEILETLRVAYSHFEELNFPSESQGKIILHWKSNNFKRSFSSTFLSDGTLRFLCLVTILLSPDPPPLICIDEPELGLHPSLLRLIADLLKNAAVRTQLVVATHSPQLVSCLDAEQVAVVESEQGATTIKRLADRPDLEKWLKDFSLGELWTMGELGGRP